MPFDFASASCDLIVEIGMPLVRMPSGLCWMAESIAFCWSSGVAPEMRSLYFQPRSSAACFQYCASTFALPSPESRPMSVLPVGAFLLSGVLTLMLLGAPRNFASNAFAAATPLSVEAARVSSRREWCFPRPGVASCSRHSCRCCCTH